MLMSLKLEHGLITVVFAKLRPNKESDVFCIKNALFECCKWISFQSAE